VKEPKKKRVGMVNTIFFCRVIIVTVNHKNKTRS